MRDASMPRPTKGHKRPADVIPNVVQVMNLATVEDEEELTETGRTRPLLRWAEGVVRRLQMCSVPRNAASPGLCDTLAC